MSDYPQYTWSRHTQSSVIPYSIELERLAVGPGLLDDFRDHVRVTGGSEDTALVRYLNTAARALEDDTRRVLLTGTVTEYYDIWPWDWTTVVHLTRAPVVSFTHVKYYDTDEAQQTWTSTNYDTDIINEPARIVVALSATTTSPNLDQRPNGVSIEYEAGYGSTVASLNAETVNAIFVKAAYLYGCGRELMNEGDAAATERCWQNEIRRLSWSAR